MYEKKLRQLLQKYQQNAEQALDDGNRSQAASYYEKCGDILSEQAKNRRGQAQQQKEELAEEYYELSKNLLGKSNSLDDRAAATQSQQEPAVEQDFSDYVDRFIQDSTVTWDDVAGLDETKTGIKESFALAAIENKPPAVEGLHTILLYGPPGTGKSLLASAIAGSHDYAFFNVKLSQALSKYYGESGKIISEVFEAARAHAPSIVFFDEIDAVAMSRGGDLDEASRRVLSTLLTELSGFDADNDEIMFLAATNAPWDVDQAILSRMEREIHVPLPDATTVEDIIRINTVEKGVDVAADLQEVSQSCVDHQYSGREVKNVCRTAIRHMISDENGSLDDLSEQSLDDIKSYDLRVRPVQEVDFQYAFDRVDASSDTEALDRYRKWGDNR